VLEHKAVGRAVHRLESKGLLVDVDREHVVLVVLPVARGLPELAVEQIWGHDLGEATEGVLLLDHGH